MRRGRAKARALRVYGQATCARRWEATGREPGWCIACPRKADYTPLDCSSTPVPGNGYRRNKFW
jgi:hypothetical protein